MEQGEQVEVTFFLDDDVMEGLDSLCALLGRTREEMLVEILTKVVDKLSLEDGLEDGFCH